MTSPHVYLPDAARRNEPAKHETAPKILNLPSRAKTLISNNNYRPRETGRQIGLELSNGASAQKRSGPKQQSSSGSRDRQEDEPEQGHSAELRRDVCARDDLEAQGKCFAVRRKGLTYYTALWLSNSRFKGRKTPTVKIRY